jgi:hypothetical protein
MKIAPLIVSLTLLLTISGLAVADPIIVDHTCTSLADIPDTWIANAKSDLHIVYQHTSHGSQLITGMDTLRSFPAFGDLYDWDDAGLRAGALDLDDYGIAGCADLSQGDSIDTHGVTPWVTATRTLLDNPANTHVNVVMWSWCSINGHDIDRYLDNMEILISEYGLGGSKPRAADHPVQFVFMTGHAEGQGEGGVIHTANEQIRAHCRTLDRVLFDFADIENYDPNGTYFYDHPMWDNLDYSKNGYRDANWGQEWCAANRGSELEQLTTGDGVSGYSGCAECAHSGSAQADETINCVLKGRAAWHLFARLAGWGAGNHAPVIDYVGNQTISPGQQLRLEIKASDTEGDQFTLSCNNAPVGASFDTDTGIFLWTPDSNDVGTYQVTFAATETANPQNNTTRTVTITVGESQQGSGSSDSSGSGGGSGGGGCFIESL